MGRTRGRGWWSALAVMFAAAPGLARGQEAGASWETISRGAIVVRVRTIRGSNAREVWAEGELDADVQDLEAAILDSDAYPRFMPYVKEARTVGIEPDGARLFYARLEPPFISPRDYVVKVQVHRQAGADGRGTFANSWRSVPDRLPRRASVVRLPVCDGSWTVTRGVGGRSRVVYRASVDPGGWMPEFLSDFANRTGAVDTMRAIEREAQRRGQLRKAQVADEAPRREQTGTGGSGAAGTTP